MEPRPPTRLVVSSDTTLRLNAAAEWLRAHPSDAEIMVLSPTREAGDDLLRAAALASGARFGLTRLTPDMLAARLAAPVLARNGRAPVTGLSLVAVAARAVHFLLTEGVLSYFGPVAAKPGFPAAARSARQSPPQRAD